MKQPSSFPHHFAETVCRMAPGGSAHAPEGLFRAAALAAQNTFIDKHVCLDLSAKIPLVVTGDDETSVTEPSADLLATLRSEACAFAVATDPQTEADAFKPLVLEENRLYLQRYWLSENALARHLNACAATPPSTGNPVSPEDLTDRTLDASQTAALRRVLANRLTVITGGPGTGKTTIVSVVLAALLKENPSLNISLCAPTGKAQARLKEALDDEINTHLKLNDAPTLKARLSALSPSTIHRLLKSRPPLGRFAVNAENPLPADVLIVDEVSMVDLSLMVNLLTAVPDTCKVILLGDSDQLAAVETGAILAEICEAWNDKPPVARLLHSHRFASDRGIGRLKDAINTGLSGEAWSILRTGDEALGHAPSPATHTACEQALARHLNDHPFRAYLNASTPDTAFPLFDAFRILCATHQGACGIEHVNRSVQTLLGVKDYGHGYPLMVTVNDYTHRLFNGDIGLCLRQPGSEEIRVWFPDIDNPGAYRSFNQAEIPEHIPVFAMTVHKAQGSGFDEVLLILPPQENRLLTRELVYTGLTRAKKHCTIWADAPIFTAAVERRTLRMSGLKSKLEI